MRRNSNRTYVCATCGRAFQALQHMRSHQSRSCAAPQRQHFNRNETRGTAQPDDAAMIDSVQPEVQPVQLQEDAMTDGDHQTYQHDTSMPHSILNELDKRYRVADDIFQFYDALTQRSELIVTEPVTMAEYIRECPTFIQEFVSNCSDRSLSKKAIGALYNTISKYECALPEECRIVTKHIPCLSHFHAILKALRSERLYREQWRRAFIDLNDLHGHLGLNIPISTTGTFRCPLQLLKEQLQQYGIWAIQTFRKSHNADGKRTFSCPCDSYALQLYTEQVGEKGVVVTIDVYCDGIALPNNGSQTLTPLRIRFSNIRGIETTWFDIGLCPTLQIANTMCTSAKLTELRSELLHRYLFLVFRPLMELSGFGFRHETSVIFPRLLMVLCDQKQERPLVAMKSSNSTRDCTTCDMLSRVTSAEATARQPRTKEPKRKKRKLHSNNASISNGSSQSSKATNAVETAADTTTAAQKTAQKKAQQAAFAAECLRRQLDARPADARNVARTLGAQLILAIAKIKVKVGESNHLRNTLRQKLHAFWFTVSDEDLKAVLHSSMVYSFCELPPSIAAFHGLGTEPFLLYKSIAFDTLHAIDLGILRVFPDSCMLHFSATINFTTIPTTQCIAVANSRLRLLPRAMQLSRIPLFLGKASDQLSGVTGLIRRQTSPFLWICILGLNTKLTPDNDPLVQAALQLNEVHCKLLGINEDVKSVHRSEQWIKDVQTQCFQLGKQYTSLFNMPVNTKLHRMMRHIQDHMTSFGMLRWGATDQNESQHKTLKRAYNNTNRRQESLAVQLLRNGYADHLDVEHDVPQHDNIIDSAGLPVPGRAHVSAGLTSTIAELSSSRSFCRRLEKVQHLKYSYNKSLVWSSLSYITISIKIPWEVNVQLQYVREKFTYRPWSTDGENIRMDGCVYTSEDCTHHGLIQQIIRNKKYPEKVFFIIRRLVTASSETGNSHPVLKFNHTRFKYETNIHGGLQLDLIPTSSVSYPAFIVIDPTVLVKYFGTHTTNVNHLETDEYRQSSRFFNVKGVPLTSFKEYLHEPDEDTDRLGPN